MRESVVRMPQSNSRGSMVDSVRRVIRALAVACFVLGLVLGVVVGGVVVLGLML